MTTIVVPFRGASGKQRLSSLPDSLRVELALAMLWDVLVVCTAVAPTIVTTSDPAGGDISLEHGATLIADPGGGQGAAVAAALRGTAGRVMVVNADLPCIAAEDVVRLETATPSRGMALAAAHDGTTNALGLSSSTLFAPLYGPDSAERFRLHGELLGVDVVRADVPMLAADVDVIEDLERLQPCLGTRTSSVRAWPRRVAVSNSPPAP
jgi:2-phospho-L-lactate guanylyltransferase